ncbi:lipoprotein-releasing system ATP-binding protein LolD, partial [Burkholderia cenocepacia]|nr:lipoprotein-releasing system ATP-binding protein LolD [Burkholderia cenocepacia]
MNDRATAFADSRQHNRQDSAGMQEYVLQARGITKAFVQGGFNVQVLNNTELLAAPHRQLGVVE